MRKFLNSHLGQNLGKFVHHIIIFPETYQTMHKTTLANQIIQIIFSRPSSSSVAFFNPQFQFFFASLLFLWWLKLFMLRLIRGLQPRFIWSAEAKIQIISELILAGSHHWIIASRVMQAGATFKSCLLVHTGGWRGVAHLNYGYERINAAEKYSWEIMLGNTVEKYCWEIQFISTVEVGRA